jgi:predicted AAA+ superfamily ATPase
MDNERNSQIIAFVRNQLTQSEILLKTLTFDLSGRKLQYRSIYETLAGYMQTFVEKRGEPRWLAIAGLRGVGKTTLLAQLYTDLQADNLRKLYIPLDQAQDLGFSLSEILLAYEEILGTSVERLETPIFLFLDEVQYQKTWAVTVKTLYDRSRNVFIVATGSSALSLQLNVDSVRRMVFEKLYPLGFSEYIFAKFQKVLPEGLGGRIKEALFWSESPQEVYMKLQKETAEVNAFWTGIDRFEIDKFYKYGNLPFAINLQSELVAYQQIQKIMDYVITKDVTQIYSFDRPTLSKLSQLVYAIAGSDIVSIPKLAKILTMDPKTVIQALNTLEKTEVLLRVYPYGAHYSQVKKPSKYLFTSSSYRAAYYNLVGSIEKYGQYKGKLLEDVTGMYLFRTLGRNIGVSITYDSAEGGADFIVSTSPTKERIILEVGAGQKNCDQIETTLKKVGGKYGLLVSRTDLSLQKRENCVSVPLEYFLLL